MESIILEKTKKTPSIVFKEGLIELEGRSTTNDPTDFYKPLHDWVKYYANHAGEPTEINIKLEYFDTASSKHILDILKTLDSGQKSGKEMYVNWFYEEGDDDMHDIGIYFESFVKIPFRFKEMSEGKKF